MNDEALFAQVMLGSRSALTELAARYYGPLRGYFYRLVNSNMQEAEDLSQETFLRLLHYRGKSPQNFRAWVFTVARNLAYDRFRSALYRREQVHVDLEFPDDDNNEDSFFDMQITVPTAEVQALMHISAETVRMKLQQLPLAQREVIIMRFYTEMKLEEIAQITNCPLGTVKSRLFKGLRQFKQLLVEVEYESF